MKKAVFSRARAGGVAVAVMVVGLVAAQAETNPSIAGNWVLNEEESDTSRDRAGGPPATALVVEVKDDEVIVHSDTGTNRAIQTFEFTPGGPEHEIPGPLSWDTLAMSAWEDGNLVVDITRTIEGPNGPMSIRMKDVYIVDGDVLTVERSQGSRTWKTVFERASER